MSLDGAAQRRSHTFSRLTVPYDVNALSLAG